MLIDCDTCQVRGPACEGCVVTAFLELPERVDLDSEACRALGVLADSGLVAPLRMVPVSGGTRPKAG